MHCAKVCTCVYASIRCTQKRLHWKQVIHQFTLSICVYMYACMYVYIYAYMYNTYVHTFTQFAYVNVCMCVYNICLYQQSSIYSIYAHIRTYMHTYIHTHKCYQSRNSQTPHPFFRQKRVRNIYVYIYIYTYTCTLYIHMFASARLEHGELFVCVCMYVCIYIYIYIYIYVYACMHACMYV
jgi:hypothetical protein